MSFWKPFSTEGKDSQSRLELNFGSGLMISVKGKMLLGAENVFLEVIGDQEERDEERLRWANESQVAGQLLSQVKLMFDINILFIKWDCLSSMLWPLLLKQQCAETTGFTTFLFFRSLFFVFFSLSLPFLLHPLPLPTPSMLAMLLFSAQCSVGMSIKASHGRKDH